MIWFLWISPLCIIWLVLHTLWKSISCSRTIILSESKHCFENHVCETFTCDLISHVSLCSVPSPYSALKPDIATVHQATIACVRALYSFSASCFLIWAFQCAVTRLKYNSPPEVPFGSSGQARDAAVNSHFSSYHDTHVVMVEELISSECFCAEAVQKKPS